MKHDLATLIELERARDVLKDIAGQQTPAPRPVVVAPAPHRVDAPVATVAGG